MENNLKKKNLFEKFSHSKKGTKRCKGNGAEELN